MAAPLGAAYALSGRVGEALPLFEAALERATASRLLAGHAVRLAWQGEAYLLAGRREHAASVAARALQLAQALKEHGSQSYALRALGDIAAREEPAAPSRAEAAYREALALAERLGMRPLGARCRLALGELALRAGRRAQAHDDLDAARSMLGEMDMRLRLEEAERLRAD